jgi:hypothetical protein
MPLPSPSGNKRTFISNCMGDSIMNKEFPDAKQRAAVCHSKWKKAKAAELDAEHYPGKNVKRRKDGVPQKNKKKRSCKKGEYRDKSGKLKKTKGDYSELWREVKKNGK